MRRSPPIAAVPLLLLGMLPAPPGAAVEAPAALESFAPPAIGAPGQAVVKVPGDGSPRLDRERLIAESCRQIDQRLASVQASDCEAGGLEMADLFTVDGRPILWKEYPAAAGVTPRARILLLGGIHGDELSSVSVTFHWMRRLNQHYGTRFHWRVVPALNPDGLLQSEPQRTNRNGVDLNRNFPTPDWERKALDEYWVQRTRRNPRRYPGRAPLSEPESMWLAMLIAEFQPHAIVSLHAPHGLLDFDGPPTAPNRLGTLQLNLLGTYPGSLGNYAGIGINIPVITIELPSAGTMPSPDEVGHLWNDLLGWLEEHIPKDDPPRFHGRVRSVSTTPAGTEADPDT